MEAELHAQGIDHAITPLDSHPSAPAPGSARVILLKPLRPSHEAWSACLRLAGDPHSLLVFLHEAGDRDGGLLALGLGADDCLSSEIDDTEFMARLAAWRRRLIRTVQAPDTKQVVYYFAGWRLTPAQAELRSPDGRVHRMAGNDLRLLMELAGRPGQAFSYDRLSAALGRGPDDLIDWRVRIHRLRSRLRAAGQEVAWLRTVRGAGYVLAADVRCALEAARPPG